MTPPSRIRPIWTSGPSVEIPIYVDGKYAGSVRGYPSEPQHIHKPCTVADCAECRNRSYDQRRNVARLGLLAAVLALLAWLCWHAFLWLA